jgi:ligand-binding sensor domain-containing protein
MSTYKLIITLLFASIFLSLSSVSAGKKWTNYTDLKNVNCIAVNKQSQTAYCGTSGGLFIVNLNNGSIINKYTNIEGLINNNITAISIDNQNKLWIGSSDGSICVLNNSTLAFKYIIDIKNSTESDKGIYSFVTYGNYIYVATGFGVIKISTFSLNFLDAPYYQLGNFVLKSKVYDLTILNDVIYAATVSGVAYANIINSNLNNPSSWTNYSSTPLNANVKTIKSFDGKVFAGSTTGFMFFDGSVWSLYPNGNFSNTSIKSIAPVGSNLFFISNDRTYFANKDNLSNVVSFLASDVCNYVSADNNQNPLLGIYEKGLYALVNNSPVYIAPNCPNRNSFDFVNEDSNGNIWGASGLTDGGAYKFDGNIWTNYLKEIYPELGNSNDCRKVYSRGNETWALFWGGGATLITDQTIRNFNPSNSVLPGIVGYPNYCVPSTAAFDNDGHLWIAFYGTNDSKYLYAHLGDTVFLGFNNPSIINQSHLGSVAIDNFNTKWIVSNDNPRGLYFFNENSSLFDPSDDVYGFYILNDFGDINTISHVIVDKSNTVWVTTNNGVYILDNPLAAIQDPNHKPSFTKLGIISGNLKVPFTENCKVICSDVLNEKWIGTESNGVFHLSEDGSTLIETFNVNNSPILSNTINSIVVSAKTGKAYFGTLYGLSSIQTNAIQPVEKFDKIICKPNPYVLPSTKNPTLTIDGLVENSIIKIITLNGEVVAEYTARQGKIDDQWNGTDKKGNLVPTGIYIVVAYNKDGSKVGTGKLAIIRK